MELKYHKHVEFLIVPMEDTWFYQRLLFEMVIVIVKDKAQYIKDTLSLKISFIQVVWNFLLFPIFSLLF